MNQTGNLLNVAASPHWHRGGSLARMQVLWFVALLPAAVAGATLIWVREGRLQSAG